MQQTEDTVNIIGYASGLGSCDTRCCTGPFIIKASEAFEALKGNSTVDWHWIDNLAPHEEATKLAAISPIAEISQRLAQHVIQQVENQHPFAVISGVHSSAIGAWSGAAKAIDAPLGLIWIDAHMDSHTPETTHTGNVHGMPLAALLGKGDPRLAALLRSEPALLPENLVLVGIRDFEPEEADLLNSLGVKIYLMKEVKERGIGPVLQEAGEYVTKKTKHFGISIDLDAIDPTDAPGVSLPTPNGIAAVPLCQALKDYFYQHPQLLGVEIAEFNTYRDEDHKTEKVVADLLQSLFG